MTVEVSEETAEVSSRGLELYMKKLKEASDNGPARQNVFIADIVDTELKKCERALEELEDIVD